MLANKKLKGFIPTLDRPRSTAFFRDTLGLTLISEDDFGTEFEANGALLRITSVQELTPHPFTVLGWYVEDMETSVRDLTAKGITFERFGFFEQDELGIWSAPDGTKVAWFKDPDGNLLSVND